MASSAARDRNVHDTEALPAVADAKLQGALVLDEEDAAATLPSLLMRSRNRSVQRVDEPKSSSCSGCGQRYSCCCRLWEKIDKEMRWSSDIFGSGPLGAGLSISSVIVKRVDMFMWGYPGAYPDFVKYTPALRFPLIIIGGTTGMYIIHRGVGKPQLKAFLRALQVGFGVSVLAEQGGFNEIWSDESEIPDAIFYLTIGPVAVVIAYGAARRFSQANKTSLRGCCRRSCWDHALFAFDKIVRGIYYASVLSIPALYYFDQHIEDRNESFQRAWETAGVGGGIMTFIQCFFDPATPDNPWVQTAAIGAFLYEMIERLMDTDDLRLVVPEVAIWTIITFMTLFIMRQRRGLEQEDQQERYRHLPEVGEDPIAEPDPEEPESAAMIVSPGHALHGVSRGGAINLYAGQDSRGHFARGRGLVSENSRVALPRHVNREEAPRAIALIA